jgi:hypothetical protein
MDDRERTVWDALDDRLEAGFPRSWRPGFVPEKVKGETPPPVDGNKIKGTFVQEEKGETTGYGSAVILIIAEHPSGELRSVWVFHEALRTQVARAQLQPGDSIAIERLGLRTSKAGTEYMDYRLAFSRHGSPVPPPLAIRGDSDPQPALGFDPNEEGLGD